jgi:hypothetical protein
MRPAIDRRALQRGENPYHNWVERFTTVRAYGVEIVVSESKNAVEEKCLPSG